MADLSAPHATSDATPCELVSPPRSRAATVLLSFSGWFLLAGAVRVFARLALAYRRPATVSLGDDGALLVKWRTELAGRILREREVLIPAGALARVLREARYPSLGFYVGLAALAVGSYVGVRTFVDGVSAASPTLLLWGAIIVGAGVTVDLVLTSLWPGVRGRCRMVFVSRDRAQLCVGELETKDADALIARLRKG
jgi:hypothetical protein